MRLVHHVSFRVSDAQRRQLECLGVSVPGGARLGGEGSFVGFDVAEDHPNWPVLSALLRAWDPSSTEYTQFSGAEIANARWLEMVPEWHHGYPQPEAANAYQNATYDLTQYCRQCGTGWRQKAPFRMTGEPKWGKRSILQLNWIFDEYFATPETWTAFFRPRGIGCRPVLNRRLAELKTVVQLAVDEEVSVVTTRLPKTEPACPECGRTRYRWVMRGPSPPLATEPFGAMARTKERFGGGAAAHSLVVVSQAIVRELIEAKVRGASFRPVAGALSDVCY